MRRVQAVAMGMTLAALCAFGVGCGADEAARAEQALGERALAYAAELCAAHPDRVSPTGSAAAAAWIAERLPEGRRVMPFPCALGTLTNVWWCPVERPVAVLVSHFDTKAGIAGFVGANDGASTTGLLLALAQEGRLPVGYLFVDGEECRVSYTADDGLHGSTHAARSGLIPKDVPILVVDMLGDRGFTPGLAGNGSPTLNAILRRAAEDCAIPLDDLGPIVDDHLPFLLEGYRAADIIDFSFGPNHAWWHTAEDTPDKLSADSLAKAAALIRRTVSLLEQAQ